MRRPGLNKDALNNPRPSRGGKRGMLWAMTALSAAVAVVGCTVGPDYAPPKEETPGGYSSAPTTRLATTRSASRLGASTQKSAPTESPVVADLAKWWEAFQDPELNKLIASAVTQNLDIRIAESRLRQARAQVGINAAAWYPTVDASGSATRTRNSVSQQGGFIGGGQETDLYRAGFDASWEIDVFGRVRRDVEAVRADLGATEEDRRSTLTSILAEVASNYVTVRGTQQQIRIANDNIESQKRTLRVNEARSEAGVLSDYEVSRSRAQVASFEAVIPQLRTTEQAAIHRLGVLLGQDPGALKAELTPPSTIPMSLPEVPIGLPSELLRRRPDIRAAERRLAAQSARIGVATADLFPRFSLTGSFGAQANHVDEVNQQRHLFFNVGPSVAWNVFDAGRIRNNIRVQNELQNGLRYQYQQTILLSLEEVENAITTYSQNVLRREALQRSVDAQQRAVDNLTNLFDGGLGDPLDVLIAQRDLFTYENQLVDTETQLSANLVAVYKSLGGGWETFRENAPPAPDKATMTK